MTGSGSERVRALLDEAKRQIALRRSEHAIPLLNEAARLEPGNAELRYEMGALCTRQGALPQALAHLQASVAANPKRAAAWSQIGTCHMLAGRPREAAAAFARARTAAGPESGPSWRLARALRLAGDTDAAQEAMREVLSTGRIQPSAAHEYALQLQGAGKREQAAELWRQLAVPERPNELGPAARAHLAMQHDDPVTAAGARRVAFHIKTAFHEPILTPGWMACRGRHHVLVSQDAEEIVAFAPEVIVASDTQLAALQGLVPTAYAVQTRHGLGSKGHVAQLAVGCDAMCLSHARQEAWFRERGALPRRGFWPIGYLQLDPLFAGTVTPAEVPRRAGRPVVLFAPTIGQAVSGLGMLGDDPVAALRPDPETFTLVIKPHPETAARHPAWWQALAASAGRHRDVLLVTQAHRDILPYVAAADLMVTDVSSVMFFFAAVDKPLVLLSNPARHADPDRFDPGGPEWLWRGIGEEVEDAAAIPAAIARALSAPSARAPQRAACRAEMFGELTDGRAGERLAGRMAALPAGPRKAIS